MVEMTRANQQHPLVHNRRFYSRGHAGALSAGPLICKHLHLHSLITTQLVTDSTSQMRNRWLRAPGYLVVAAGLDPGCS